VFVFLMSTSVTIQVQRYIQNDLPKNSEFLRKYSLS